MSAATCDRVRSHLRTHTHTHLRLAVGNRGTRTHTESTPGSAANGRPYAGAGYCLKITSGTMALPRVACICSHKREGNLQ